MKRSSLEAGDQSPVTGHKPTETGRTAHITAPTNRGGSLEEPVQRVWLPSWANELLTTCPKAGSGVHRWLFRAALKLHRHCPNKDELERLLDEATASCGREVPASEIEDAVSNSLRVIEDPEGHVH